MGMPFFYLSPNISHRKLRKTQLFPNEKKAASLYVRDLRHGCQENDRLDGATAANDSYAEISIRIESLQSSESNVMCSIVNIFMRLRPFGVCTTASCPVYNPVLLRNAF